MSLTQAVHIRKALSATFAAAAFVVFMGICSGCGKDTYAEERMFWKTNQAAQKIFLNPNGATQPEILSVANRYLAFAKEYPNSKFVPLAHFAIAKLWSVKGEYDKALAYYEKMQVQYKASSEILADIAFYIGNIFEKQDNWSKAQTEYKALLRKYPNTRRSLLVPLYLMDHYKQRKDDKGLGEAQALSLEHFRSVASGHPNVAAAYIARGFIAQILIDQKKWSDSLEALTQLTYEKYNGFPKQDAYLFAIASIYAKQLNDEPQAIKYFQQLLAKYPRSPFGVIAKSFIEKSKNKETAE
jgi:TolA-binding protein